MFEALIYDQRDKDSDHPESTLGETYHTAAAAWLTITNYIEEFKEHTDPKFIYRAEVIERP